MEHWTVSRADVVERSSIVPSLGSNSAGPVGATGVETRVGDATGVQLVEDLGAYAELLHRRGP
jgi:hypothetical protein